MLAHGLKGAGVIGLQHQEIVGVLGPDPRGDVLLRAHGVERHDGALEMQVSSSSGMAVISFDLPSTSRCRDTRNTRYRAARYARPGRDVHPVDRASFAWRTVSGPRVRTGCSRSLSF